MGPTRLSRPVGHSLHTVGAAVTDMNERAAQRLRLIRRSDFAEVWRIRYAVSENTLRPGRLDDEDLRRETENSGRGWVVEGESGLLAFAVGNAHTGNIWALFVHPDAQGQGHGLALHETMLRWLWSQGLGGLWLTTGPGTRAEGFYRRRGWLEAARTDSGELRLEISRPDPATHPSDHKHAHS